MRLFFHSGRFIPTLKIWKGLLFGKCVSDIIEFLSTLFGSLQMRKKTIQEIPFGFVFRPRGDEGPPDPTSAEKIM